MNCNEEFVVKVIGKMSLEMGLELSEQKRIRDILYYSLHDYEVVSIENSLVVSDMEEKIILYLQVKKMENYSDLTLKNYTYTLRKLSQTIIKPVSCITKNDLVYFLINESKGKKPSTKNSITYILKSFFGWLADEEIISSNPSKNLTISKLPKRLRKSLTVVELEKIRNACETDRERALVEVLFSTGGRISEIVNMNVSDIQLDNSVRVIGKGDKERTTFINDKTRLYIEKYLQTRDDNSPSLFVTKRKPYVRLKQRAIQTEIKAIKERAKIDKPVTPHIFRHSNATLNLKSGMSLNSIQHLLGHASPTTTLVYCEQNYNNLKNDYDRCQTH
ncbi:MAG: site-specific tyrosine recombinase/integron integrase [Clostridium sp.]